MGVRGDSENLRKVQRSMADEEVQNEPEVTETKSRRGLLMAAVAVAALVGGTTGMIVVGPLAAERFGAEPAAAEAEAEADDGHGKSKGKDGHGGDYGSSPHYRVENLVLNPAETQGTRFLMATIVAELHDEKEVEALGSREAEVRDRLLSLLGSKTVGDLTDVTYRDTLKEEIRSALDELVGENGVERVFLPTFVIQ